VKSNFDYEPILAIITILASSIGFLSESPKRKQTQKKNNSIKLSDILFFIIILIVLVFGIFSYRNSITGIKGNNNDKNEIYIGK